MPEFTPHWTCNPFARNYLEIIFPYRRRKDWYQDVLLNSDTHLESIHSDLKWLRNVYKQTITRKAPIIMPGDVVDAMQGRHDPRRDPRELNPELVKRMNKGATYYQAVKDHAVEFLEPFRKNITLICPGNHETAVEKNGEWNMTSQIVAGLGHGIYRGGYAGNVRFTFRNEEPSEKEGCRTKELYYHHGTGLSTDSKVLLMVAEHPDVHIFAIGNWHRVKEYPIERKRILRNGDRPLETVQFVQLGTIKDERGDDNGSYGTEKYHRLTRPSAHWLRFYWDRPSNDVQVEVMRARAI